MKRSVFILAMLLALLSAAAPELVSAEGEYDAALQLYYKGNYAEAVKYLKEYVEKKPDPAAYYLIGYALYELGRYGEADEYFEQAYLIDPTFSPEESGLTEKFPKGLPRSIKKPPRVHKGRAVIKKKKTAVGVATKPAAKQGVAPAGKKETAKTAAVEKPAQQAKAQKPAPQPSGMQAKVPEQQKAVTPQKKAFPQARPIAEKGKTQKTRDIASEVREILKDPLIVKGLAAGVAVLLSGLVLLLYLRKKRRGQQFAASEPSEFNKPNEFDENKDFEP
jgi:tetratricopeptide (TPR) repeat protein